MGWIRMMRKMISIGSALLLSAGLVLAAAPVEPLAKELNNYPALFLQDKNFNGYIVVGENAKASDVLAATDIVIGLANAGYKFPSSITKLTQEITKLKDSNLILVGGPCVNSLTANFMNSFGECTEGFNPGKAKIMLYENGEKIALVVAGYSGEDTRAAGKILENFATYKLSGKSAEVERGGSLSEVSIVQKN